MSWGGRDGTHRSSPSGGVRTSSGGKAARYCTKRLPRSRHCRSVGCGGAVLNTEFDSSAYGRVTKTYQVRVLTLHECAPSHKRWCDMRNDSVTTSYAKWYGMDRYTRYKDGVTRVETKVELQVNQQSSIQRHRH